MALGNIKIFIKAFLKRSRFIFSAIICLYCQPLFADVVKPALIEINVNSEQEISIEIRASIEALLTGINAQYKNTQDAPTAEKYDELRKMQADELQQMFVAFKPHFLNSVILKVGKKNGDLKNKITQTLPLQIGSLAIPPAGYTKVPRISIITLTSRLPESADSLQWYYPEAFGDNAVRVRQVDKKSEQWHWSQWQWLRKDKTSEPFSLTEIVAKASKIEVIALYIAIGFEHIVPKGLDHILFILGLFLLANRWRPLLWQVTMFTVAHTITLALAMNHLVELPASVVEPLIALSIAYVGMENLYAKKLHQSRLILVFIFGLLHGLGFASVLTDFSMPKNDFVVALISFNVGVEFGQIAVISAAFILAGCGFWLAFKEQRVFNLFAFDSTRQQIYKKVVVQPGSLLIALIGLYWFIERLELF